MAYWVSTGGSDTNGKGTASAPFRTLDRARQAVRATSARGQCAIYVNIEAGTYALAAPVKFDAGDSGSAQAPVIYRAAPGNQSPVVLSGGIPVGLSCDQLNICTGTVADLPPHTLPRQFYVDGGRAIRARSNYGQEVNPDYTRVANGYEYNLLSTPPLSHPELVEAVTVTQWKMMRCPVASVSGATLVMANPCWKNANTYPVPWNFQLLSWLENAPEFLTQPGMWYLDPYSKQLTYIGNGTPPKAAVLPVLQGLVELMGTPAHPVSNIIFRNLQFSYATWMGPNPAGWQGAPSSSTASAADGYVSDQSGYILKGDQYSPNAIGHQEVVYKTPGNITLRYAHHITFDGDTFMHLGGVGLDMDTGSQDNRITNNVFNDISSAAIVVGGVTQADMRPDSAHETSGNLIDNNAISYTGRDYYDSAGIYVGFTTGTKVIHNTIDHTPWSSIAIGWGWGLYDKGSFPGLPHATRNMWGQYSTPTIASHNEISSNLFEHFLEKLWDGGAIYTNGAQGQSFASGLLIKQNVARYKRPEAGSNIYYTDGGSQYITLEQNVTLDDPTGTMDFGPCGYGSSISPLCLGTGVVSYGADMGGCLPVGDIRYIQNYFADTLTFFGPDLCHNSLIPPYPVNLTFTGNVPTSSAGDVPNWILLQAGTQ